MDGPTWPLGSARAQREQLAFYGAYHSNGWNQLIHVVFVPLIWATAILWVAYTPPLFRSAPYWANWSLVVFLAYAIYYAVLDWQVAVLVDSFYLAVFLIVNRVVHVEKEAGRLRGAKQGPQGKAVSGSSGPSFRAAKWALALHVLGWYMQIHPGHALLEGRKPALLDSFVQSLTLAPLFVWYEAIWFVHPQFKAEMRVAVDELIKARHATMPKPFS